METLERIETLERRIANLEKSRRRIQVLSIAVVVIVGGLSNQEFREGIARVALAESGKTTATKPLVFDSIRAKSIEVIGELGTKVSISAAGIEITRNANEHLWLMPGQIIQRGNMGITMIRSDNSENKKSISIKPGYIEMENETGVKTFQIDSGERDGAQINVRSGKSKADPRKIPKLDPNQITPEKIKEFEEFIKQTYGEILVSIGEMDNPGGGFVDVHNSRGKRIATLQSDKTSQGLMGVFDMNGKKGKLFGN